MKTFTDTTLRDIDRLNKLLAELFTNDPVKNFDIGKEHREVIEEIDGCLSNFLDSVDAEENHQYGKAYRATKAEEDSVAVLLGRQKGYFVEKLKEYRRDYIAESLGRLFPKKISDMTGKELNEYLQLIGLLK